MQSIRETSVVAFWSELEKIAAGPLVYHEPGLYKNNGLPGKWVSHADLWKENPALARQVGSDPNVVKDVVFLAPKSEFVEMHGERGEEAYKAVRRHEMAHWMRAKRGNMSRMGKPGIRGVGSTLREELVGHVSALKGRSPEVTQALAQGIIPGAVRSTQAAYRGTTLRKAALGGSFGKALRAVRLIK